MRVGESRPDRDGQRHQHCGYKTLACHCGSLCWFAVGGLWFWPQSPTASPKTNPELTTNYQLLTTIRLEINLRPDLEISRLQNQRRPLPAVRGCVRAESCRDCLPAVRVE